MMNKYVTAVYVTEKRYATDGGPQMTWQQKSYVTDAGPQMACQRKSYVTAQGQIPITLEYQISWPHP